MMARLVAALLVLGASALSRHEFVPLGRQARTKQTSESIQARASVSESPAVAKPAMESAFEADDESQLAAMVPLSELGYQEVAETHDPDQMKIFVRRILASESRAVRDEAGLSGLVPYYCGEKTRRKMLDLKNELREKKHRWWIEEGTARTAPLNQAGYKMVAAMKDNKQMKAFMRRVLAANGLQVAHEGKFSGVVPFFSGKAMEQSYQRMLNTMRDADWVSTKAAGSLGASTSLNQAGYASLVKVCKADDMKAYIVRLLEAEARVVKDKASFGEYLANGCQYDDLEALKKDLRSFRNARWVGDGPGRTAPLSEEGFQQVVEASSNKQMKAYMRRVIAANGKTVQNEGDFSGMVQFFSGVGRAARSWQELRNLVGSASWLVETV